MLCKQDAAAPDESAFAAESASLKALRAASMSTGGLMLRVPRPLGFGALPLGGSFLLLEWVEGEAPAGPTALGRLGAGLAALHTAPAPPGTHGHGFRADTWLGGGGGGGLRQDNRWGRYLSEFFIERRLRPQLAAAAAGDLRLGAALEVRAIRRNSAQFQRTSLTPPLPPAAGSRPPRRRRAAPPRQRRAARAPPRRAERGDGLGGRRRAAGPPRPCLLVRPAGGRPRSRSRGRRRARAARRRVPRRVPLGVGVQGAGGRRRATRRLRAVPPPRPPRREARRRRGGRRRRRADERDCGTRGD